jgi:hypothetical protein
VCTQKSGESACSNRAVPAKVVELSRLHSFVMRSAREAGRPAYAGCIKPFWTGCPYLEDVPLSVRLDAFAIVRFCCSCSGFAFSFASTLGWQSAQRSPADTFYSPRTSVASVRKDPSQPCFFPPTASYVRKLYPPASRCREPVDGSSARCAPASRSSFLLPSCGRVFAPVGADCLLFLPSPSSVGIARRSARHGRRRAYAGAIYSPICPRP